MESAMKPVSQADGSRETEIQKKRLRENCREFESVMVSYLMKTMRDGVIRAEEPENAQAVYEDMLDGQISKTLSKTSSLGIGDMLYASLEPLIKKGASKGAAPVEQKQPDNTDISSAATKNAQ